MKKDPHIERIRQWVVNRDARATEQWQQLWQIKTEDPTWVDATAQKAHQATFAEIDCTRCANCCIKIGPAFRKHELQGIAHYLGISPATLVEQYLKWDPVEQIYEAKSKPCPFLGENQHCTVYEYRPEACQTYPHTDMEDFVGRRHLHANNSMVCPAVYHIIDRMTIALQQKQSEEKLEQLLSVYANTLRQQQDHLDHH